MYVGSNTVARGKRLKWDRRTIFKGNHSKRRPSDGAHREMLKCESTRQRGRLRSVRLSCEGRREPGAEDERGRPRREMCLMTSLAPPGTYQTLKETQGVFKGASMQKWLVVHLFLIKPNALAYLHWLRLHPEDRLSINEKCGYWKFWQTILLHLLK